MSEQDIVERLREFYDWEEVPVGAAIAEITTLRARLAKAEARVGDELDARIWRWAQARREFLAQNDIVESASGKTPHLRRPDLLDALAVAERDLYEVAQALPAPPTDQKEAQAALDRLEARNGEDASAWAANLSRDLVAAGEPDNATPRPASVRAGAERFTVKETNAGPYLMIDKVEVRSWLGTYYNSEAYELADMLNSAIAAPQFTDEMVERASVVICEQLAGGCCVMTHDPERSKCNDLNCGTFPVVRRALTAALGKD